MKILARFYSVTLLIALTAGIVPVTALSASTRGDIIIETNLNIQVLEDENERQQLLAQAQKLGGHFINNATRSMQLRIPAEKLMQFLDFVRSHWRVYSQDYRSRDAASELLDKQSELAVKSSLLKYYQDMLAKTQKAQFLKVARAADELVAQIETIKGRIAYLKRSAEFALVSIQLAEPVQSQVKATSTFDWINQSGLSQLMQSAYNGN